MASKALSRMSKLKKGKAPKPLKGRGPLPVAGGSGRGKRMRGGLDKK